jgi:hypothetical protein
VHVAILGGIGGGLGGGLSSVVFRDFGWGGIIFMILAIATVMTIAMWMFLDLTPKEAEPQR